ncbi:MAG: GTP-binding protein [Leptolyngbya sp. SIO4C1]|nr:GTP-binding protein [Leptolyngbya sp. SIO4C1]
MTRDELLALIDQAAEEGWTELDLSGQGLTELPPEIGKLTQLEKLVLGRVDEWEYSDGQSKPKLVTNELSSLPPELAALENLKELSLSGNPLRHLPAVIFELKFLTILDLTAIKVVKIPECVSQLTNLTCIEFSSNYISEIPEYISQLKNLVTFTLYSNYISEIPECISQLKNLSILGIDSNQIKEIPKYIGQLTNLTELWLYSNQISEIPECIGQLKNLTTLGLASNQISEIPKCIGQLKNLTTLWLAGNQISEIPECIGQLKKLTTLWLYKNQISEIPECIGQLKKLITLGLASNKISEIPEHLSQLTQLEKLDFKNNKINNFPEWLKYLPCLKMLDLRRNPLPIFFEVLGPSDLNQDPGVIENIFNYFHQLNSGTVRPLNEAKLLLVGQGSVGKTSLIQRLLDDRFNPNQSQTDGLNVREWTVHVNSKDVRLNVWDFGGQEIYHATHQFFLTKRSLYLLVCNCRTSEDENRLEYWLKLIQSFGDASPVIIVGNKCDEQPLDINRKALREKYPNIQAILETSCQTAEGIEALRQAILHEVAQLRDVYNLLPLSWFEVKEQLERMDRDFISYSEYIGICHQHAIPEEQNQNQLIDLLHNLGLVLNFREHPLLHNTSVLNPDWVTEGIYALLSDDALKTDTRGQLALADMSRVLPAERYPANRHHYLIGLMKEFQLCFELPDCRPVRQLIPGLLPKEEPEKTDLEGDILEFQYHYTVLPTSIISRFIVLTHEKIHNQTYWRSGVMLAYAEGDEVYNIARVKADPADSKIFIAISGRDATRRTFLGILRDTFNKIHVGFAKPTEWVPVPDHPEHPPLDYQELLGLEAMGVSDYPIGKLRTRVNLRQLLDGYEPIESRRRQQHPELEKLGLERGFPGERLQVIINNSNQQQQTQRSEDKSMTEITNNNQGANIGNLVNEAKDQAQIAASHFTQTSGASPAELLQIVAHLRQLISQFPADTQTGMIIDLEDVAAEIKKPEDQRSQAKLKHRLLALLMAASAVAGPVASVTDFANNVTDLGSKVGIELRLP